MCLIQLTFIVFVHTRMTFYRKKEEKVNSKSISIIICCRNEEENLLNNLQTIVEQDYPNFEVILVNHMSTDGTIDVMRAFQMHYPNVRVINVQRSSHLKMGKKFPLSIGVKAAKNELILLTDADCQPTSNKWIEKMVAHYSNEQTELVIGYGPMNKKKGVLNWLFRFETAYIAVHYFSYALAKIPYMSVGRNFSYTKEVFERNKGFKSHYSILSGDDDLFLQEANKKGNVAIEIAPETWCYSDAKETWKEWVLQKQRHYSASEKYKVIKKLLLGIYNVSWLLTLLLFVILLFDVEYNGVSLLVFGGVLVLKWIIFTLNLRRLEAMQFAFFFPLLETVYMIVTPFVYFTNNNVKTQRWR